MKTVAFKVSKDKDLQVLLEVIKKFGFSPEVSESQLKSKKLNVVSLANTLADRKLTPNQIDKLIAEQRHAQK